MCLDTVIKSILSGRELIEGELERNSKKSPHVVYVYVIPVDGLLVVI